MGDAAEAEITLDSGVLDELNSPAARSLFDTIDSLRELQIGDIVNLPQIIVVGDQSSGKSSVLEAISRVRFPTKGDLCTRFATELVVRRAPETKIDVRIDYARSRSSEQFHRTSFDEDALAEILTAATEKMGIHADSTKDFSEDVLRVEISKPDAYPLTLVDLPGFFHSATGEQTQQGKQIVLQLAERYMKQSKSIILAVVEANHNLANQIVVEEARKHDPTRERTLGVITKPDLTAAGSQDEKKGLQLAKSQEPMHKLKFGWHVLCNRPEGEEDTIADSRDTDEEMFFQTGAWSTIAPANRGIAALRKKLSRVLHEHIQKTLPGLVKEIESNLSARQRALERLGNARSEPAQLRTYLLEIAEKFQRLARDGLDGRYNDDFFGWLHEDRGSRKLRAVLRTLSRAFHKTMLAKGMDRLIEQDGENDGNDENDEDDDTERGVSDYLDSFLVLFDGFSEPEAISQQDLYKELERQAAANQGTEFPGQPNSNLSYQLFKMQAHPWGGIGEFYLDQVIKFAKSFVEELFVYVIGLDTQTINAVLNFCVDDFFIHKRLIMKDKLHEILRPYASAYCPPLAADFHASISLRTKKQDAGRVASLLEEKFPAAFTDRGGRGLSYEQVQHAIMNEEKTRASEFGIERVIAMTMTHYEISLGTFTQNVVNLAVENCLVSDLATILTPSMVVRMSEERLKELASESDDVQVERHTLQHEVNILRSGLEKCQKSRPHERTVLSEAFSNVSNTASRGGSN